jgi:hypothetical protein
MDEDDDADGGERAGPIDGGRAREGGRAEGQASDGWGENMHTQSAVEQAHAYTYSRLHEVPTPTSTRKNKHKHSVRAHLVLVED